MLDKPSKTLLRFLLLLLCYEILGNRRNVSGCLVALQSEVLLSFQKSLFSAWSLFSAFLKLNV